MLYMLERTLREHYIVISLSFEAADDLFESRYLFVEGLVRRIAKKRRKLDVPLEIQNEWNTPVSEQFPFEDFNEKITRLCAHFPQKIVLMIDEVDKNADNQIFLSFLGLLRTKYLEQQKGEDDTFQSVILAGVYDIKNLKLKLRSGEEQKYNSPWNIAADFNIDMNFSVAEIAGMLLDYEKDHEFGMDVKELSQFIFDYTTGYPYLVSRLCRQLDDSVREKEDLAKQKAVWTKEGILKAVNQLLKESNVLFDDMHKKITKYPDLREMIYMMLFHGQIFPYHEQNAVMSVGKMFGFISEKDGHVEIANRIFEIWFYNLFISEDALKNQTYHAGLGAKKDMNCTLCQEPTF